jgi:hypothetical protein
MHAYTPMDTPSTSRGGGKWAKARDALSPWGLEQCRVALNVTGLRDVRRSVHYRVDCRLGPDPLGQSGLGVTA